MKYIILFIGLVVMYNTLAGQSVNDVKQVGEGITKIDSSEMLNNSGKIKGIGIFKIGDLRNKIIPLAESKLGMKTQVLNSSDLDYEIRNGVFKKVIAILKPNPDLEFDYPYNYSFCPNTKVYYIKTFEVSDIKLKNIYLKFYNDTLVDFTCDGDMLIPLALKKLYGDPEIRKETENSNCGLDYSDKGFAKLNIINYENWYNDDIICAYYSSNYYDATCRQRFNEYLHLYSRSKENSLLECDRLNKPDTINKKSQKKIKNLDEF